MWEQYKKTFFGTQALIAAVALALFVWSHSWHVAARFFFMMQVGSAAGVIWGIRLRKRLFPNPGELPRGSV